MDEFKRTYSNKELSESLPYLWQNFDKENYSFWYCEYKYADELKQIFMTSNLVGGKFLFPLIFKLNWGRRKVKVKRELVLVVCPLHPL